MSISLASFGAVEEVTGSNHVLTVGDQRIMVDFGLFQGRRAEAERKNRIKPYDMEGIQSLILTHAHCDHCGRLPVLPRYGFNGNIFCTPATRDIASLVMSDSAHIQMKDAEFLKKKDPSSTFEPLYNAQEVTQILSNFITVSYGRDFNVIDGVKARFYDAGHIVGAALTLLDLGENRKVCFTGDLGRPGLPIIRDPEFLPGFDYLVCESTYGARLHQPIEDCCKEMEDVINRTAKRGGKVLIPAFAIERTQDLLYYLNILRSERRIPNIPIYVDSPMAFNVTSVYRVHQECYDSDLLENFINKNQNPFGFNGLNFITDVSQSMELNERHEPCIIISSSGMCEAGRILHHLKNNIEDRRNTVMVVGFMAEHTLGRRIVERDKEVRIFGKMYKLNAEVATLNTFSAHADYSEILKWIRHHDLNRLKKVFLVHGEHEAQEHLVQVLLEGGVKAVEIVKPDTSYSLWN